MLEEIKLVGGIAGLATAAFTIWDRWTRGRPLAWVTAKKSVGRYEYIRIKNPGHGDLFILGVRAYPAIYSTAKDHSVGAIMAAAARTDVNILLRPDKMYDLPIIDLRHKIESPTDQSQWVCFLIYWRKTSSTWLPQFPAMVITSTRDIDRIVLAAAREDDVP